LDLKRFDVTAKDIVWLDPPELLRSLGVPPRGRVEILDSDITTMTTAPDMVLRVDEAYLVTVEIQCRYDADLERNLWYRHVALDHRHGLPVLTLVLLFRKEANLPALRGKLERRLPDGTVVSPDNYRVVRLWTQDVETFLTSGASLLPLAPLANVRKADLPGVVRRMAERLDQEPHERAAMLWGATYILMGLRYEDPVIDSLLEGVRGMFEESTTFQAILRRGREQGREEERAQGREAGHVEGARRILLCVGRQRFGSAPDAATLAALEAIHDFERIVTLAVRVNEPQVQGWADLLDLP
jgi:predicted transposase YdaD